MALDTFTVSPSKGASDPVGKRRLVQAGRYNLNAPPLQERSPVKVRLEFNQWFQFEKPAKYTVTVSSLRASRISEMGGTINWDPSNPEKLTCGPIEVEIVDAEPDCGRRRPALHRQRRDSARRPVRPAFGEERVPDQPPDVASHGGIAPPGRFRRQGAVSRPRPTAALRGLDESRHSCFVVATCTPPPEGTDLRAASVTPRSSATGSST